MTMRAALLQLGTSGLCAVALLSCQRSVPAGTSDAHRIVFEVSVDGPERWEGILNNVDNVQKAFGAEPVQIEVVAHAKGLGMLLATNEPLGARMREQQTHGVIFAACENTMRKQHVTKEQLLPAVTTVDSGVAEVVRKQEAGWSYLKGGS